MDDMAEQLTPKLGLKKFTSGTDPHPTRTDHNAERDLFDSLVAMASKGLFSARPAAGKSGRFYFTTDAPNRLYFDDGVAWFEVSSNGGGGAGAGLAVGGVGVEGVSTRSARADHTHPLPLATSSVSGAMSAADKAKLDNATAAATASRVVIRDASGRAQFASPSVAADAATKSYVDGLLGGTAGADHTHSTVQITIGVFDPARLPSVTSVAQGAMLAADKVKLDAAASTAGLNALVIRDAAGRAQFVNPAVAADVANKSYVDTQIGTRAPTTHNHTWAQITSGVPAEFTPTQHEHDATDIITGVLGALRLPAASTSTQGAMSAADKVKLDGAVSAPTASRLVIRDASGRAQFATPSAAGDAAPKSYVDAGDSAAVIASRLPAATTTTQGALSPADKQLIDTATPTAVGASLVQRWSFGGFDSAPPQNPQNVATKGYVDTATQWENITGRPNLSTVSYVDSRIGNHTHDAGDVQSGVFSTGRVVGSVRAWTNTTGPANRATIYVGDDYHFFRFTSSERYKENIESLDSVKELDAILRSRPVIYDRKDGTVQNERGMIAEEQIDVFPEFVVYDDGKPDGLNYEMYVTPLIASVQELYRMIVDLRAEAGLPDVGT